MAKDPNFPMQGKLGGMGGQYGRKAENLTKKQLKRAGATKAAAGPKVSISQTSRDTNRGITLGPKGKPLTGRVKLENGNMAVYKAGKRVINVKSSKDSNPTPPKKSTSPGMNMGAKKRAAMGAANAPAVAAAKSAKLKTMDVEAKRVAAKRRPVAGKSTASTKPKKSVAFGEDTALMYGLNTMKRLGF